MKRLSLIALSALSVACSPPDMDIDLRCYSGLVPDDTPRADMLVIGDSVSDGYTYFLRRDLSDMEVIHSPCNARSTRNGVKWIDSWLDMRDHWSVVTFNFGLWDIGYQFAISDEVYRENIREIALKIKDRSDRAIFLTTTYVPKNTGKVEVGREEHLNAIAIEVMNEVGVEVLDLNAVSKTIKHLLLNPAIENDVHFQPEGYRILADSILAHIGAL